MQDNIIIMEINAPKEHQAVITRLIHGLADLYIKDKTQLFPYPETMIDEGQTSPAPDILLYDHRIEKTAVIIEVAHSSGAKKDCSKVQNLMVDYDVEEGFVYDYKLNKWYTIGKTDADRKDGQSFCKTLNLDLASLIKR